MVHRGDPICAGDQEFAGDIGLSGDEWHWSGPAGMASAGWLVDRGGVHGVMITVGAHQNPHQNPHENPHHSKKSEKSVMSANSPGQETTDLDVAQSRRSGGSSIRP